MNILENPPASVAAFGGASMRFNLTSVSRANVEMMPPRGGWRDTRVALECMLFLSDDWDGQGAIAPSSVIVSEAVKFARELHNNRSLPPTRVAASPDGTIAFEWQIDGNYYTIEIVSPSLAAWVLVDVAGRMSHGEFPLY